MIQSILQAKASLGRCQRDSLNFFQRDSFIAAAWSHASYLTFIASYITITVNTIAKVKKSLVTQYFIAIAIVVDETSAEWTDGIHQLAKAFVNLNLPILIFEINHFIKTAIKKAIIGIINKFE